MGLQLITGAAAPLTAAEVRSACSIAADETVFDGRLNELIAGATAQVEDLIGRSIGTQTWDLTFNNAFPAVISMPQGPVTAISWIKYFNTVGSEVTLSSSVYLVDLVNDPQQIVPAPDEAWPDTQTRLNAVSVRFGTGYATVPAPLLDVIRAIVVARFTMPESMALPPGIGAALEAYVSQWIFA